jgi:uncharacterized phage-like protein YoqJ
MRGIALPPTNSSANLGFSLDRKYLIDNLLSFEVLTMILDAIQTPDHVTPILQNRIVVATGHRPQKCGGFSRTAQLHLRQIAIHWLAALNPRGAISGMALGWDTAIVEACLNLGLPYVACVPFRGQESQWPLSSRRAYANYIRHAAKIIICSPGEYSANKMQIRNERMIHMAQKNGPGPEHSILLAMWDGSSGGTNNCLSYARTRMETINAWPDYVARSSLAA